ncbi:unnamed protein product [Polarella glacialis]|uniref:GST N-terminal domain-containing protein n=1 Tax=Polarella glacialis TaxID=89957 RepID=A0A813J4B6_POLGL|nr:unnamed protein product [Polarella glacialis]
MESTSQQQQGGSKRRRVSDEGSTTLLRLYRLPVSNCCSGVLAALRYKGLAFEDCEPPGAHYSDSLQQWRPGYGTAQYKEIVRMGSVPAVVLKSPGVGSFVLSESATICEWLEDRHASPALLPPAGEPERRARLRFVIRHHDLYLSPATKALFKYCDPRSRAGGDVSLAAALSELGVRLRQLEELADEFGGGPRGDEVFEGRAFTLVDCCLPITLLLPRQLQTTLEDRQMELGCVRTEGRLGRWLATVIEHPVLAPIVAEWRTATDAWISRKRSGRDDAFEEGWWNVGRQPMGSVESIPIDGAENAELEVRSE